jgi:hypothetical protein
MCSAICGGAQAILEVEPEITEANMDEPYRVRIPYPFEWRVKLSEPKHFLTEPKCWCEGPSVFK